MFIESSSPAGVLHSPNKQLEGLRLWFNTNTTSCNCYRNWRFPLCECVCSGKHN